MHPITLTVSTGRCGTTYLERTLKKSLTPKYAESWVSHELLGPDIAKPNIFHRCFAANEYAALFTPRVESLIKDWTEISQKAPVVDFGWTMRSLIPGFTERLGDQIRILFLHRHPVSVAASFATMGAYCDNSSRWQLTPFHDRARYPMFQERWTRMSPFEKCLYMWLEVNQLGLELKEKYPNVLEVKSSNLFNSQAEVSRTLQHCGFHGLKLTEHKETNRLTNFSNEHRPIKNEWSRYREHPEVHELAETLGYDMSNNAVEALVDKYRLPSNFSSIARHYSLYWPVKKFAGRQLRRLGLLK